VTFQSFPSEIRLLTDTAWVLKSIREMLRLHMVPDMVFFSMKE